MCVIHSHKHKTCECEFVTQIERCEDYKQKPPNKVAKFCPTFFLEKFRNSTKFFRQKLDGIEYTTATSWIIIASFMSTCPGTAKEEIGELALVCPFCDDQNVQHQLEQLVEKSGCAVEQKMGAKKDEVGEEGEVDEA